MLDEEGRCQKPKLRLFMIGNDLKIHENHQHTLGENNVVSIEEVGYIGKGWIIPLCFFFFFGTSL